MSGEAIIIIFIAIIIIWIILQENKTDPKEYHDDKGRLRCIKFDKIVFKDEECAQQKVDDAARNSKYLRAYQDYQCGHWHLTSQIPHPKNHPAQK